MSDTVIARLRCVHEMHDPHPMSDESVPWCDGGEVVELHWRRAVIWDTPKHRLEGEWEPVDGGGL